MFSRKRWGAVLFIFEANNNEEETRNVTPGSSYVEWQGRYKVYVLLLKQSLFVKLYSPDLHYYLTSSVSRKLLILAVESLKECASSWAG